MSPTWRRRLLLFASLGVLVAVLWQCTGAFDRDAEGDAIDVFGPWLGADAEAFTASLDGFTERTGIVVNYTGSSNFDSDLRQRVSGGLGLPDVALIPQPALIAELLAQDLISPLSEESVAAAVENYPLTEDDLLLGGGAFLAPYRTNVKSLVWYRPDVFEDQGWGIPTTLDELGELTDQIATSDIAPWCFSVESGDATGWPATDWIEDLLLRRGDPEDYDAWVRGELDFESEAVRSAFQEFDDLVLSSGHTVGGAQRILSTPVSEASAPLFDDVPGCAMYKQASFAASWFPDGTEIGPDGDVDFFVLPGATDTEPAPLVRGGDGAVQFDDRNEVSQLVTYLITPEGGAAWAERGGYLSGRDSVELDYYTETDARFAELLREDRVERFDASDQMFSDLRDEFLEGITEFVAETSYLGTLGDLDRLLQSLDESRRELTVE